MVISSLVLIFVGIQLYRPFNIRIIGLRAETWTNGDRYVGFHPTPSETLTRFRDYVANDVTQHYDAAMLLT